MKKMNNVRKIGLFVILTLVAIYIVINFLKGQDLFNKNNYYYSAFENVEGLTATGPVYIRGLKVGTVESIKYDHLRDRFTVKISVKSDYAIPANSVAEIYSADLLGGKSVRINLGDSNLTAKEYDTLASSTVPDMMTLITGEIGPLKDQAQRLLENMNTALDNINAVLDSGARENLSRTFVHLNRTLENAETFSRTLNGLSPEINELVANLTLLSRSLSQGSDDLNASMKNLNQITSELSEADLKATVAHLNGLLEKLQDPRGSVGKLLTTDSLHQSLDSLLRDVNELVLRITENPKKYIKVSVF